MRTNEQPREGHTCPACGWGVLHCTLGVVLYCYPYGCTWRLVFGEWRRVR